ncbi:MULTISPECIES: aspartyl-phosphate phosphatase Spo0E family protein [unclassified Sporolactobacillus]|uniref:aspartyl-phosphate phosphatase Spo0E family protein n=1 Tax=unclassified Sporolactobacillus TaxID=2628533 RepID=UPI002367CB5C|nr:aspartyl-phosphate phosphatase Spo0E family protein [Sporolactobacillus sp. CQH2019]MDD9147206.1 aspartyl-phosphate phosphatase Spo0E family protein [Sporolactobacillus sp. CQH2019]
MCSLSVVNKTQEIYPSSLEKIEKKRKQLFHIAKIYGMYAAETLRCSRELDEMIVEFQQQCLPARIDS